MPIKYQPSGEAERAALAGRLIGEGRALERERQRQEKALAFLSTQEAQKELAEFQHQLAIEKAKFNETMDFEKFKAAQQWDLQKLILRSQIDFEKEEKKRAKDQAEYEAGIKIIEESNLTDERKSELKFALDLKKLAGFTAPKAKEEEEEEEGLTPPQLISAAKLLKKLYPKAQPRTWYAPWRREPLTKEQEAVKDYLEKQILRTQRRLTPLTTDAPKKLDQSIAAQILREANGDKDLAREIARRRGYTF